MVFYATRYLDMPNAQQSRGRHQVLPEAIQGIAPNTTVLSMQPGFNRSLDNALNAASAVNTPRYAVQFTVSYPRLERILAKSGHNTNEGLNQQLKGQSFSREHIDGEYLLLENRGGQWIRRGLRFIDRPLASREVNTAVSTPEYGSPALQAVRRDLSDLGNNGPHGDVSSETSFSHHEYAPDAMRLGRDISEDLPEDTSANADPDIDPPLDLMIGHLSL